MTEMCKELCDFCRQPTVRSCKDCGLEYCYACPEQEHWKKCTNFEICKVDDLEILKAERDLFPGEVIFEELPALVSPKVPKDDQVYPCLGCCRIIPNEKVCYCPECMWPICSLECEGLQCNLRHGLECKILRLQSPEIKFRFDIIFPLRVLLLQITNKKLWDKNVNDSSIENEAIESLQYLEHYLDLLKQQEEETETVLLQQKSLSSKFLTNLTNNLQETDTALIYYSTSSLLQQNCVPNTFQTIDNSSQFKLTVRANSAITKTSIITANYANLFHGTHQRLETLKKTNKKCSCIRCEDPTELGTLFCALKCLGTRKEACGGTQLPVNPTDLDSLWVCDKCNIELPGDEMIRFVNHLGGEVAKVLSKTCTVADLEEFLAKLFMFLHPNHFYVCGVKKVLVELYDEELLVTKTEILKGLIEVATKFYPNGGTFLGDLTQEMFKGKFLLLQKNNEENNPEKIQELRLLLQKLDDNIEVKFNKQLNEALASARINFEKWLNKSE